MSQVLRRQGAVQRDERVRRFHQVGQQLRVRLAPEGTRQPQRPGKPFFRTGLDYLFIVEALVELEGVHDVNGRSRWAEKPCSNSLRVARSSSKSSAISPTPRPSASSANSCATENRVPLTTGTPDR